jgi:hypothetical protein
VAVAAILALAGTVTELLKLVELVVERHQQHTVVVHLVEAAVETVAIVMEQVVEETMVSVATEKEAAQVRQAVFTFNILQIRY